MNQKENFLRVIHRDHPQWVPNGMESVITVRCPIVERPSAAGKDAFGVLWDYNPNAEGGTYPHIGGETIHDLAAWREELVLPDLDAADWSVCRKKAETIDRTEHLVNGFVEMGLFERSYLLLGMEEALCDYLLEPDEMEQMATVLANYKIALIEHYYEAVHPNLIWYGDDWGNQRSPFLPPALWRRIIKPHTARIYDRMKQLGIMINQHSCGMIEPIVGDIVEMGADMLNPCQPCNNLAALKRQYGDRICFIGGIDSQFVLNRPGVTSKEVKNEVRTRIREMAANGGYVAMPSHDVPYDPMVLDAMNDAIKVFGKSIYS